MAPHWRLTEEFFLGEPPTRDFLRWDGVPFHEQKSPKHYISNKIPDHPFRPVWTTRPVHPWTTRPVHPWTTRPVHHLDQLDHPSRPYSRMSLDHPSRP